MKNSNQNTGIVKTANHNHYQTETNNQCRRHPFGTNYTLNGVNCRIYYESPKSQISNPKFQVTAIAFSFGVFSSSTLLR